MWLPSTKYVNFTELWCAAKDKVTHAGTLAKGFLKETHFDDIWYAKELKWQSFSLGRDAHISRVVIKLSMGVALQPAQKSQSLDGEGEPW